MLQPISSEIKLVKSLKNCFLGPICTKKGVIMGHAQNKNSFFGWYNKSRSSAFRNIICFDWVMNLKWCFLSKKCHFQLKQLSFHHGLPILAVPYYNKIFPILLAFGFKELQIIVNLGMWSAFKQFFQMAS